VSYAAAMTDGHTATEIAPRSPCVQEITRLWVDLKSCFHENMKSVKSRRGVNA
jgi:hypothetical protein